jgi:hypothetical protein
MCISALMLICTDTIDSHAQATAQISGTVRDQSGAVLPGVEVTATQTETGITRTTISNETGSYVLPNLLVGPYRLEAGLPGFRTFVQTGLVLQVSANVVVNPNLEVGQVTEQVEVQANAAQVETRSVSVSQVIENQRILELPLNARQVTQLITLSGAAVETRAAPGYSMGTGVNIAIAGGNEFGVQYALDGAPHLNMWDGSGMPLPFPDALQEFRLVTGTQEASSGMRSGAAVNAVLKSGTNTFHGNLFEFVRNNKFNARDFFATTDDGLKRNQFGGTIGGPIVTDKLFFFGGYQGETTRQRPIATTVFVPTAQMLAGDFSTFVSPACQGGAGITLRAPFVNNRLTPAQFSPAAVRIAAKLPKALDDCGRYVTGAGVHENRLQIPVRIDYQATIKQSLFARYMITTIDRTTPYDLSPSDVLTTTTGGVDDRAHSLTFGHTYLFGPNVVNSFRLSGNHVEMDRVGARFFGWDEVGVNIRTYIPKWITMNVNGGFNVGSGNTSSNQFSHVSLLGANDDVTVVRGAHQFAFGGHAMRSLLWNVANTWAVGSLTSNGQITGTGMTDFFTGNVGMLRQANENPENLTQNFFGLYGQDTWKVTPKLTLNLGIRWEPFFPMSFKHGEVYTFSLERFHSGVRSTVMKSAPPGFFYPGDAEFNGKAGTATKWWQFDPRVGIAWDPAGDGKTSIRLGAGISRDYIRQDVHKNTSSVSPFRLSIIRNGVNLDDPWSTYPGGNPFPYSFDRNNPLYAPYGAYTPVPADMNTMKQYTWNLGIQRQMTPSLFASATYLGTRVLHIWNSIELNPAWYLGTGPCTLQTPSGPVSYAVCSTTANIDQRRILNLANPNVPLGYLTQYDDGGTQSYHGLLLDTRWRGNNLNFSANYTWSHCIGMPVDTLLNPGANYPHGPYQNNGSRDRDDDVGNCLRSDRRHIANATLVARTPMFSNNTLRLIASGWSFSTIFQARSGESLNITLGTDNALNGFTMLRPNQIAASAYGDRSSLARYLDRSSFAVPAPGTLGNVGFNSVVGPGYWTWDEAVSRQFQITEGQRLEIRAEAFNITNSLRRGNPGTNYNQANNFGIIRSSNGGPRIMQFALKYVF